MVLWPQMPNAVAQPGCMDAATWRKDDAHITSGGVPPEWAVSAAELAQRIHRESPAPGYPLGSLPAVPPFKTALKIFPACVVGPFLGYRSPTWTPVDSPRLAPGPISGSARLPPGKLTIVEELAAQVGAVPAVDSTHHAGQRVGRQSASDSWNSRARCIVY